MARHGGERPTATSSWQLSPPESRIPRPSSSPSPSPSPTALRRSASLRGSRTRNCVEHRTQQLHHNQDHLFPVITENGTVTPKRCYSSLSLTPSRGRARASPGSGQPSCGEDCSDAESVKSFGSGYSTASACDHASFALNGTTWSGRSRRYVVHCSSRASDNDEYLTPTQRAQRQIRKFQSLLKEARKEIEDKDREIFRLTKELVELRLYKASLNSPDEKTDSSEAATVRENNPFSPESPCRELSEDAAVASDSPDAGQATTAVAAAATVPVAPHPAPPPPPPPPPPPGSSLVDSGHFEDGSVHSKESVPAPASPAALRYVDESPLRDEERKRIVDHYEGRIEEMHRRHVDEIQSLKESHNDKVESLLNQLSDISTRYCETRPSLDKAEARAREAEAQLETLRNQLAEQTALLADQEERNKQMYLKMYSKGQEAARIEQADQIVEQAQKNPSKVSVGELLQQLTVTQAELENVKPFQDSSYSVPEPLILANRSQRLLSVEEAVSLWVLGTRKVMYRRILESRNNQGALDPEITLQFLKSAIYYFLTDKENLHGHLNAIESILGFTESEKLNIDRIYRSARK